MSIVRPRSHSSELPDPTSWQRIRRSVNDIGGNSDEDRQFRRNGRRGDGLPSSLSPSSSHSKGLNDLSLASPPKLPMTPAEFHLFPSASSTENTRNPQDSKMDWQDECLGVGHLTTLRSAAFWELRQSVIENGEGLIRRMRDYEQSRLHQQVRQKAKERKKRGHKSSTLRSRCKARPNFSGDDILICSEDTYNVVSRRSHLATRARSLDPMDVDGENQGHLGRRGSRSIPGADYQLYYDEGMLFTGKSLRTEVDSGSLSLSSYPESASPTPSSSYISLPLPRSFSEDKSLVSPASPSEKALADLNVAFANGACSITDYSPIWTYQQQLSTDEHDNICHGDLWW